MCFFSKAYKKEKVKLRHFKLDEFDSPDEKGSGKKMDKTFLLFLEKDVVLNLFYQVHSERNLIMKNLENLAIKR